VALAARAHRVALAARAHRVALAARAHRVALAARAHRVALATTRTKTPVSQAVAAIVAVASRPSWTYGARY